MQTNIELDNKVRVQSHMYIDIHTHMFILFLFLIPLTLPAIILAIFFISQTGLIQFLFLDQPTYIKPMEQFIELFQTHLTDAHYD